MAANQVAPAPGNFSPRFAVSTRMLATLSLVALLAQTDPASTLLTKSKLNCRDWAEVANYYIDLGEENACTSLLNAAQSGKKKPNTRVSLICRILFQSKGGGPLRKPKLGDLSLPSFPLSSWPEFPLFEQDGVWFLLDENYILEDHPEAAAKYLDYCRQTGKFRTDKLKIPTHQEAVDAFRALQGTKRWRGLAWSDSDLHSSSTYHADWTLELLKSQTHFTDTPSLQGLPCDLVGAALNRRASPAATSSGLPCSPAVLELAPAD